MSSAQIVNAFPIVERCTWLNHAAISPWPAAVTDAMRAFVDDNRDHGPLHYADWLKREQRVRERAASLLNAESGADIALCKNTSEALNLVAGGLDWRDGDNVVFPAGEFPSNALPWRALARSGVEVRETELDTDDPEASLISALDDHTRLLAFSSVRYDTGLRLDIERLGEAAREHDAWVCIDAIQHVGALPLDVSRLPVDFIAAGSHKWLLAPEGIALFWSRPEARAALRPTQVGWRMWEDMFSFSDSHDRPPDSARRFEPGTLNNAGIHGLDAALGLLLETGPEAVARRIDGHAETIFRALDDLPGAQPITPADPARRAGIVTLRVPDAAGLVATLEKQGIHAAVRGGGLRLSPHFYTPDDQLEQALACIRASLQRRG